MPNELTPIEELRFLDTTSTPVPGAVVPCLLCAKPFVMRPFIGEPDQVCGECWKTYNECARVICKNCRVTIGRVVPKVLESGFRIRPRMILHSSACNICRPGLTESTIIEIDEWEQTRRNKKIIVTG